MNPDPTTVDDRASRPAEGRSTNEEGSDGMPGGHGAASAAPYWRFGAMIATSMVVMFVLTYVNTYEIGHIHFSETRLYMTFIMGAAMRSSCSAMIGMYKSQKGQCGDPRRQRDRLRARARARA